MQSEPSRGQPAYVFVVPVAVDQLSDDVTVDELRRENYELRDIVASLQTTLGHKELGELERTHQFEDVLNEIRSAWESQDLSKSDKESLSVLHGLAERLVLRDPDVKLVDFLEEQLGKIRNGSNDPLSIEREATRLGLPVCHCTELPDKIICQFGYVNVVEDGMARISIMDDDEAGVRYTVDVPLIWIPEAYRDDTARVAWVERCYSSGVRGQIEPASGGPVK